MAIMKTLLVYWDALNDNDWDAFNNGLIVAKLYRDGTAKSQSKPYKLLTTPTKAAPPHQLPSLEMHLKLEHL
jgi:hypothetical protein